MINVTTNDSKNDLYEKSQQYIGELYDVLLTGVKLGIIKGHLDGESVSPEDMAEGIKADVDEILTDIIYEFNDKIKDKVNDLYLTIIDEI